ncbi:MAG TPA: hypothetical protein PK765_03495 [bacterium]|nr:hypothetical protein [bacterium]
MADQKDQTIPATQSSDTSPVSGGSGDTPASDGSSTGGTSLVDGSAVPAEERNAYLLARILVHPFTKFDERAFLNLLENSLSLNIFEKKRVVDAIPTISQYQVDELIKVFEDERVEFKKLMPTEGEIIKQYVVKARREWIQLYELYRTEDLRFEVANEEQGQIDDIKKNLGL